MSIEIKEAPLEDVLEMRHRVMYPSEHRDFVKLDNDHEGNHLGLYDDGQLMSVISLFEVDGHMQFRKFATRLDAQGRGYGTTLLKYVFEWAGKNGIRSVWCNARRNASAFYERFGLYETGEPWVKYGFDFIKMEKKLK